MGHLVTLISQNFEKEVMKFLTVPRRILLCATVMLYLVTPSVAIERPGEELEDVGLSTTLGDKVDLSLEFTDSNGKTFPLSDLTASGKPILLLPVYYTCPRLCGLTLNGLVKGLNELTLELGDDYEMATVSFNSDDTPERADKRAKEFRAKFKTPELAESGWHFLVGEEKNVSELMQQIGFKYKSDKSEFSHTTALMVLTPTGEISQYFSGISFPGWDLRLALVEASKGSIGTAIDHALLFCFRFDPTKGKYTWAAFNVMRAGAILTLLLIAGLIFKLRLVEKGRRK